MDCQYQQWITPWCWETWIFDPSPHAGQMSRSHFFDGFLKHSCLIHGYLDDWRIFVCRKCITFTFTLHTPFIFQTINKPAASADEGGNPIDRVHHGGYSSAGPWGCSRSLGGSKLGWWIDSGNFWSACWSCWRHHFFEVHFERYPTYTEMFLEVDSFSDVLGDGSIQRLSEIGQYSEVSNISFSIFAQRTAPGSVVAEADTDPFGHTWQLRRLILRCINKFQHPMTS